MQLALSVCLGPSLLPQALAAGCVLDASSSLRPVVPPKVKRFLAPRMGSTEDRPGDLTPASARARRRGDRLARRALARRGVHPRRVAAARGRGVRGRAHRRSGVAAFLTDATSDEAQLALSFLVWPGECPDPRVVDEWLRRREAGPADGGVACVGGKAEQATQPGKRNARRHPRPAPAVAQEWLVDEWLHQVERGNNKSAVVPSATSAAPMSSAR